MPQSERLRVWKGELKRTSGGLTIDDLIKNKRGKIVSKRKSEAAKKNKDNNLGQWLRSKGDQFLSKGLKAENIVRKNKAGRKAFKKPEPAPKKKKVLPPPIKAAKKKVVPAKKKVLPPPAAPPKISKTGAPSKPGDKVKDKTKIAVGHIETTDPRKIKRYRRDADKLMKGKKYTRHQVMLVLGKPPKGFEW